MKRINRKKIYTDFSGNPLYASEEVLKDHETGFIEETYHTAIGRCEACDRPVEKINDICGRCIQCKMLTCSFCAGTDSGFCSICKKGPICASCRQGFPAKGLHVCDDCMPVLQERLDLQDQLLIEKIAFERAATLCNLKIKLTQLLQQSQGNKSSVLAKIAQLSTAKKIARLERQMKRRDKHGQKLLP